LKLPSNAIKEGVLVCIFQNLKRANCAQTCTKCKTTESNEIS